MTGVPGRRGAGTALVALLAASLGAGCGDAPGGEGSAAFGQEAEDAPIPSVEAVQARHGVLPLRERLSGSVRAAGQVAIYPQTSGPVVEVLAENGDFVNRGDPLVRIRAETSRSQLAQARANLDVARAEAQAAEANLRELEARFERTLTLAEDDLVSAEAVETQRAEVESARAGVEQARARVQEAEATVQERAEGVAQTTVRAPISGQVGRRNVEVGMRVDGQTALFTLGSLERMRVQVPVTQEMMGSLRPGQRAEIRTEGGRDTVITAEVSRISPFLAEGSFSAEAEIDLPNGGGALLPGMFVTVDVFYGESDSATIVPRSALYERPETGQEGVYQATSLGTEIEAPQLTGDEGKGPLSAPSLTRFRSVEVLAEGDQTVAVDGLEPGDWVVVVGQQLLSRQAETGQPQARVRPVSWDRVVGLQRLQRDDLLRDFMDKQQRLARQEADSAADGPDAESTDGGSSPM